MFKREIKLNHFCKRQIKHITDLVNFVVLSPGSHQMISHLVNYYSGDVMSMVAIYN